jgi:hypothetical protein
MSSRIPFSTEFMRYGSFSLRMTGWNAFALMLAVVLCGCEKRASNQAFELPIFFTCDTQGRLEPCGCFAGQFGGLTRLRSVLASQPRVSVRVDVGDAIGGREDYDIIQYRYMLQAFADMNYDVLNAGHREAQLSATQLQDLRTHSPLPLMSANLVDRSSRKPLLDSYRIVQRNGMRICLVGVVDPNGVGELGDGLVIEAMESAITRVIEEVRGRTDMIVLLAFADEEKLMRLAQQFYEVDVILGGKVRQPAQELRKENRSLIYFVTNEARALGILTLKIASDRSIAPGDNKILLLHDRIPQAPEFIDLVRQYRAEIRRTRLAVDNPGNLGQDMVPGVRAPAEYVGSARCVACHAEAGTVWEKSGHSHAFATLQARDADGDPKCIACHTIGFGSASGYQRSLGARYLVDVGCESCHGPGSLHVRKMEGEDTIDFTFRPLDAGDCQKCHYGEFSRPFKWDEFWSPIRHGKETRTATVTR